MTQLLGHNASMRGGLVTLQVTWCRNGLWVAAASSAPVCRWLQLAHGVRRSPDICGVHAHHSEPSVP